MNLGPIIATSLGILIYRAAVAPAIGRYLAWKHGPRVKVARRNWRGDYVPDLAVKRVERALWLSLAAFLVFGGCVSWTILTFGIYAPPPPPPDPTGPPVVTMTIVAPTNN